MILHAYSIYDTKTAHYAAPFFVAHEAVATRAVGELCSDLSTSVGRHPQDYTLWLLGHFDDQLGTYHPEVVNLGPVLQYAPQKQPSLPLTDAGVL